MAGLPMGPAGLPNSLHDPSLTCDVLRIELRGFAQNELRQELKACLVELRRQLLEDMQACVSEAVATPQRLREGLGSRDSGAGIMSQYWSGSSLQQSAQSKSSKPKNSAPVPPGAPRMLPAVSDSKFRPSLRESATECGDMRDSETFKQGKSASGESGQASHGLGRMSSSMSMESSESSDGWQGKRTKARGMTMAFRTYVSDGQPRTSTIQIKSYDSEESAEGQEPHRFVYILQRLETLMDWPVSIAIGLNGLFLGIQAQYQSHNLTKDVPTIFTVFEFIFSFVFLTELIIRIANQGLPFFYGSGWRRNWFDTALVFMALVEVSGIIGGQHDESGSNQQTNLSFLRLLRILRVLRVLRLARLIEFISELNMIISSITTCMRSLFWTMVLLLLMVYMMGIFFTQLVFTFRNDNRNDNDEYMDELDYWWGSLFRSTLSLYEAILGGADWDSLVFPMAKKISVFIVPIFVLYIAFSMLAMMNVITGIFVETALKNAAFEKDNEFITLTREVFADDVDEVGILKKDDFERKIAQEDMKAYLKTIGIKPKDAKLMFNLLDGDENGSLSLEALMAGMIRLRAGAKALDIAVMMNAFEFQASRWMIHIEDLNKQADKVMSEIDDLRSQVRMR